MDHIGNKDVLFSCGSGSDCLPEAVKSVTTADSSIHSIIHCHIIIYAVLLVNGAKQQLVWYRSCRGLMLLPVTEGFRVAFITASSISVLFLCPFSRRSSVLCHRSSLTPFSWKINV